MEILLTRFETIYSALPYILGGAYITVFTVISALALGFILGIPLAVLQVYGSRPIQFFVRTYVWFFRGVPILLLLFLFYFGFFKVIGLELDAITSCSIVLGFTSAAYQSQIFRASILSLPQGQLKAAKALGMTDKMAIKNIIIPQALRLSIPGWSNEYSILLKDSALCFALGAPDIMARAGAVASRTYEHLTMYIVAGFLYFCITFVGIMFLRKIEKRVAIPGYIIH